MWLFWKWHKLHSFWLWNNSSNMILCISYMKITGNKWHRKHAFHSVGNHSFQCFRWKHKAAAKMFLAEKIIDWWATELLAVNINANSEMTAVSWNYSWCQTWHWCQWFSIINYGNMHFLFTHLKTWAVLPASQKHY